MAIICIDTRPLAAGHLYRGIGTYVGALVEHLGRPQQAGSGSTQLRYLWPARAPLPSGREPVRLPAPLQDPSARVIVKSPRIADLKAALRSVQCEVYHATTPEGMVIPRNAAVVATLYDLIPLMMPRWGRNARHLSSYLGYHRSMMWLARADHVIAISQATKRDACEMLGIPPERITVVPLAADPARAFVPSPGEMTQAQALLNISYPYFLGVASTDPHKNILRAIEAFAAFRKRMVGGERYSFYFTGTWMGLQERRIRRAVAHFGLDGAVRHLPDVPSAALAPLYHGAVALVFPSLLEGFGLPILEAMMCDTPVITSNCSSMPEAAGDAAYYVDPRDARTITEALFCLASDQGVREELIVRGRTRRAQFSWQRVANETMAVYRHLIG